MPLTKSEFDRWKAQADEADAALNDRPTVFEVATICRDGKLLVSRVCLTITETRALYEMLRAWYGESLMTEKAKAVIEAADAIATADGILQRDAWDHFVRTVDAYRAEQKQ